MFEPQGWSDYLFWQSTDATMLARVNSLLKDAVRIEVKSDNAAPVAIEQRVHFADDHLHKHRILDHLLSDVAMTQSIVRSAAGR